MKKNRINTIKSQPDSSHDLAAQKAWKYGIISQLWPRAT